MELLESVWFGNFFIYFLRELLKTTIIFLFSLKKRFVGCGLWVMGGWDTNNSF